MTRTQPISNGAMTFAVKPAVHHGVDFFSPQVTGAASGPSLLLSVRHAFNPLPIES